VKRSKACGRFEVTADGQGMTGRSGTALLAETADRIGLTAGLSRSVGGCRSWIRHDPGKVVRDLVVMLADGGDALRHMKVLDGQPELFGDVASAATVNRTIVALANDELVVERLDVARRRARARAWAAGAAPPVVAAAHHASGRDHVGFCQRDSAVGDVRSGAIKRVAAGRRPGHRRLADDRQFLDGSYCNRSRRRFGFRVQA
jgi:hypothetical protein